MTHQFQAKLPEKELYKNKYSKLLSKSQSVGKNWTKQNVFIPWSTTYSSSRKEGTVKSHGDRTVNTTGLRLWSLERTAMLVLSLCQETWISGRSPVFPKLTKVTVTVIWFMLKTCFPSGSLEFWYVLGRGCPWPVPNINLVHWICNQHFHR